MRRNERNHFRGVAASVCALLVGAALRGQTWNYEVVHAFRRAGQPAGSLLQASDGFLYGTTDYGGLNGVGTVYRMDSAGSTVTLHSFGYTDGALPKAALIQASDGMFYGTTSQGGASNLGTVFRLDAAGNVTRLHSFNGTDGAAPVTALLQAADGYFYGTTSGGGAIGNGTVFRIDASGNLTTIHTFGGNEGAWPTAALIQGSDGALYGTTPSYDPPPTAFRIDSAGSFSVLHVFGPQDNPSALIQAADGNFYGTTRFGGPSGQGSVFRMDANGGLAMIADLSNVAPNIPLMQASDAYLYGADPVVFRMDYSGNKTFVWPDGAVSYALVQGFDGSLYGANAMGANGSDRQPGTALKVDLSGSFTTLHVFESSGPADPRAALIQATDGNLYGTTYLGGDSGLDCDFYCGTVYRLDGGGAVTTVHSFADQGVRGANPVAPLIQAADGNLYGTTYSGGANAIGGTAFKIGIPSFDFEMLHTFCIGQCSDGYWAYAGLTQAADGNLYGVTLAGNGFGGAAFKMTPTGTVTSLHKFGANEGHNPMASLIQGADGNFYGTHLHGPGITGQPGTVFKMDSAGTVTTLYDFADGGGGYSRASLLQTADGSLYGTTSGFCCSDGTVFRIDSSGVFSVLHNFGGNGPWGGLMQGSDGDFYGTTPGTVFRIDASGILTTLHAFNGIDGDTAKAALIEAADGHFYGTTSEGGPGYGGVVFRLGGSTLALNAVTPSGPASGGYAIDAVGGGFLAGASLTVGGFAATDLTVLDPTFLYALTPALAPGTLNDVTVSNPGNAPRATATLSNAFFADFLDVPQSDIFHDFVETIFRAGITAGCGNGNYCRNDPVRRDQMAVFLLKAEHGAGYAPPPCAGAFGDVPCPGPFTDWIEQLAAEGITGGCGGANYCPGQPVTRAQMAAFLLKTEHGPTYAPPACAAVFGDVSCPSQFADWIEELYAEQVTGGCQASPLLYCPGNSVTRGQMAVFLVKTFGLQ